MVILALDVGARRIGVAVADPRGRLATPLGAVVRRDGRSDARAAIADVARERGATSLLVGVPLGPNGEETPRAASIRAFANGLAASLALPVAFRDERNTTQDALARRVAGVELPEGRRHGARRPPSPQAREAARRRLDAMAAAVLLQAHLDETLAPGDDIGAGADNDVPATVPPPAVMTERHRVDPSPFGASEMDGRPDSACNGNHDQALQGQSSPVPGVENDWSSADLLDDTPHGPSADVATATAPQRSFQPLARTAARAIAPGAQSTSVFEGEDADSDARDGNPRSPLCLSTESPSPGKRA
jgi:putative Holliday junction resolvase